MLVGQDNQNMVERIIGKSDDFSPESRRKMGKTLLRINVKPTMHKNSKRLQIIFEKNNYLIALINNTDVSPVYQRQSVNAIKFYYEKVLGRELNPVCVPRPKKAKKLPTVLGEQEIVRLFRQVHNLKHKCILSTIYAAGLRRSKVLNLKISDIDSERHCIIIRDAKGNKDRVTLLSQKLLVLLREYYRKYKPKEYLFEGANGGK